MLPKDCPKIAQSTLEAIIQDPYITIGQLSEVLKLSERTIKNRVMRKQILSNLTLEIMLDEERTKKKRNILQFSNNIEIGGR